MATTKKRVVIVFGFTKNETLRKHGKMLVDSLLRDDRIQVHVISPSEQASVGVAVHSIRSDPTRAIWTANVASRIAGLELTQQERVFLFVGVAAGGLIVRSCATCAPIIHTLSAREYSRTARTGCLEMLRLLGRRGNLLAVARDKPDFINTILEWVQHPYARIATNVGHEPNPSAYLELAA